MTEAELIEQAKKGVDSAFAQLVQDNEHRVYSLALRMTGNQQDALDLSQEAFLRAWRTLPSFRGDSSFATWIYRLTSNVCIDHLRRQKRRTLVEDAVALDDPDAPTKDVAATRFDPQIELERAELRRAVDESLRALPEHHRQVLVMRELSELSYQEIADTLALDVGTVKSRIARARFALRKILLQRNFSCGHSSTLTEINGKE